MIVQRRSSLHKAKIQMGTMFLYLKNLLLFRSLNVEGISIHDCREFEENEIELQWKATGCYKIDIMGVGIFPGNLIGLKLIITNRFEPIEIRFYGIRRSISQQIGMENMSLTLPDIYKVSTQLPRILQLPVLERKIELELNQMDLSLDLPKVRIEL